MIFDEIIYGTQYYRSPTPLKEEWAGDIARLADFELDAMQIRINWRWNERVEDEYDFSDIDELMSLAEKNGRKVVMKFLLECAPQYVFDKYGGTRIGPKGEQIRGASHGAFYGGWRPCFTNRKVQERAVKFVEKVAERYANRPNIIFWNAWNEIRNTPMEDCFCPECRRAFGEHLKAKYGTIENLNNFHHTAEESFENIALPAMAHGYWDIYEYKLFKGSVELSNWLLFVKNAIRKYDKKHPVMSHAGYTSGFQSHIGDICDDFSVSKTVDFWGTSIPNSGSMEDKNRQIDFLRLNDFVRAINENYFLYEIYPGLGMFYSHYDTPFDMDYKLYTALGSGAKGLMFWQYRSERVGMENDCAGLMRMNGEPREVAFTVRDFGKELHKNMKYFVGATVPKSKIAIVFDFNSLLMSEIEDACGKNYDFVSSPLRSCWAYYKAHVGMYRLLKDMNFDVDYVDVHNSKKFADYKVLYFPYFVMADEKSLSAIGEFIKNGGTVLADEGFAMREPNTWMNPYDLKTKPFLNARMLERRLVKDKNITADYKGNAIHITPYCTQYEVDNANVLMNFADGTPAMFEVKYGKGKFILNGFSVGAAYEEKPDEVYRLMVADLLNGVLNKNEYSDNLNGVYAKIMKNGKYTIVTFLNTSKSAVKRNIKGNVVSISGSGKFENGEFTVPEKSCTYVIFSE